MILAKRLLTPFSLTLPQWNYAIRNTISIALALWMAFILQLDAPFWAMTSAAVVGFPTTGGILSKSLGRIIGSILGAIVAFLISAYCMTSPYLFTFYIALWLGICTYLAHNYNNNVSYAFALAGYTASIIAFTAINTPDVAKIYDITQARLTEVLLGILCCTIVSFLIPHEPDDSKLFNGIIKTNHQLIENAKIFCKQHTRLTLRQSQLKLISHIYMLDIARIQAYWSRAHIRYKNKQLNFILHEQFRLLSLTSSMRRVFMQWKNKPANIDSIMDKIFDDLKSNTALNYFSMSNQIIAQMGLHLNDMTERVLLKKIVHFCRLYNEIQTLTTELLQEKNYHHREEARIHYYIDHIEALKHGARTALAIIAGCFFSIETQWTESGGAMTILSICCVLYSSALAPINNVLNLIKAFVMLLGLGFLIKFAILTRVDTLEMFFLFFIPFMLVLQILKVKGGQTGALFSFFIVFFGSMTQIANPPTYDVSSFLNSGLAKICGGIIAILAFSLLPPSSLKIKNQRIYIAMKRTFYQQISRLHHLNQRQFESVIYSQINQLKSEPSGQFEQILRASFVFINCSYAIDLMNKWQPKSASLTMVKQQQLSLLNSLFHHQDFEKIILDKLLAKFYQVSHDLIKSHDIEAHYFSELIWHLYSTFKLLEDYVERKTEANSAS